MWKAIVAVLSKTFYGDTPLHSAIRSFDGDISLVKSLLEDDNSQINVRNFKGEGPLHLAVQNKSHSVELVKLLLEHGADVRATTARDGNTALHWLAMGDMKKISRDIYTDVRLRFAEITETLVEHGSDVNARNLEGDTPLHSAALQEHGYCIPICILLEHGSDANATNVKGDTSLHLLLRGKIFYYMRTFTELLEKTGDINAVNSKGETPLHLAVRNKSYTKFWFIKKLLDRGADVSKKDATGENAYQAYCHFVQKENRRADPMLEILLQPNEVQQHMDSSLHVACLFHRVDSVHRLLRMGADVNAVDNFGSLPLSYALIASGADVDKCSTVRLLLDYGADANQEFNYCDIVPDPTNSRTNSFFVFIQYGRLVEPFPAMLKIFFCHMAKLRALHEKQIEKGFYVDVPSEEHYGFFHLFEAEAQNFHEELKNWRSLLSKELKAMNETEIGESRLSFLDLLLAGANELAMYAKNKELVKAFHAEKAMFPICQGMLDAKLAKGQWRLKLLESAAVAMSDALRFADPSDEFFQRTLSYCSNEDLGHVIELAIK